MVGSTIACLSSVVYFIFGGSSLKPLQMFTWNRKKCYDDANCQSNNEHQEFCEDKNNGTARNEVESNVLV